MNHWKESQHCYSLDLETQRVWDYVGDGYVHRLIQSKTDGKLVELPAPCRDGSDDCSSCEAQNQREDMDAAIYSSKLDAVSSFETLSWFRFRDSLMGLWVPWPRM